MPATGHELTRRALLVAVAPLLAEAADPGAEAWDVVTAMALALGRGSDGEFLALCDPSLAGYSTLRANLAGLVAAADVESGIDPVKNEGDNAARDLEVDWQLSLVDRSGLQRVTRRRQVVKCRMEKRAGKWKVVALDPVAFFAPPSAGVDLADQRRARRLLR
jgi:hypothetical protein